MALQPWQKGIITRIEKETSTTKRFWVTVPTLSSFDFVPGQFVTLDLPIHEKINKRLRSYSIASWPDGTNTFELVIVLMPDGVGSKYLFNEMHEGSELTFRGPQGTFKLPDPITTDLIFIATGTGIAPFRSMVHYIKHNKVPHKHIYLVFGTRTSGDLLYYNELKRLEAEMPSFSYIPTLSREKWEGCCGYVHAIYENIINEKKANGIALPPASFFLCGWRDMIDEAKRRIQELGYEKKAIHQELYG
jgi:CDP-4-dehydro-6-deoxyglucose reductase